MARTLLSFFVSLAALGCTHSAVQGIDLDVDGDGVPDPIPAGRAGPWFDCMQALDQATVGDVCDFEVACAHRDDADRLHTMVCDDHRIVPGLETMRAWTTCDESVEIVGSCVEVPEYAGQCASSENGRRVLVCVGYDESPPSDGIPGAPWPLVDADSCADLEDGRAENGDPCEGDFVCDGAAHTVGGLTADGHGPPIGWCDGGTLRIVVPMQAVR